VVVITGASSGIGRACAEAFAKHGTRLVLAARRADQLQAALSACQASGAPTIALAVDVGEEQQVRELAAHAVERFGRIDVWVNSAGVIAFGRFLELPSVDFRRVIDTNLFGQVHGARVALDQFQRQSGGVLINLSSVWGRVTSPYVSAYVASKFAVRAFSKCLQEELADTPETAVVTVLPQAIDTPIWQHAANHSGRAIRPVPPVADARRVAEAVVACAQRPRKEITVGATGRILEILNTAAPGLYARLIPGLFRRLVLASRPADDNAGNLHDPAASSTEVDGGWLPRTRTEWPGALTRWRRGIG
jgi:NAD(P)-dependent dehydrogenase (short-subunit alcohol dehydrogenase family)